MKLRSFPYFSVETGHLVCYNQCTETVRQYTYSGKGNPMARPRVLDARKQEQVVALVTAGMRMRRVADYVGCSLQTISRERKVNPDFDQRMRQAKMATNLKPLEAMRRASATHWRAAAWMLERDDRQLAAKKAPASSFGPRELDNLCGEVIDMLCREVDDPLLLLKLKECTKQVFRLSTASSSTRSRPGTSVSETTDRQLSAEPTPAELNDSLQAISKNHAPRLLATNEADANPTAISSMGKPLKPPQQECSTKHAPFEDPATFRRRAFAYLANELQKAGKQRIGGFDSADNKVTPKPLEAANSGNRKKPRKQE